MDYRWWIVSGVAAYLIMGIAASARFGRKSNNIPEETGNAFFAGLFWPLAFFGSYFATDDD